MACCEPATSTKFAAGCNEYIDCDDHRDALTVEGLSSGNRFARVFADGRSRRGFWLAQTQRSRKDDAAAIAARLSETDQRLGPHCRARLPAAVGCRAAASGLFAGRSLPVSANARA